VVSYNGVISALATQGRAEEALSLLEEMKDNNLKPNRITFQKLASAIRTSTENIAKSEMLQHILTMMSPYEMRANVGGPILEALIRQYGAGGRYSDASHVFEQIQGPVDAGCLQAMLYACAAGEPPRWEDALNFLHTSDIVEGTWGPAKVDSKALSYAMIACAKADQWEEALNLAELYGRAMPSNR
jgi:pentatricopeptide repeat protein